MHGGVHGDASLGREGARRGRRGVAGVLAIITRLMAQKTVVGRGHVVRWPCGTVAEIVDGDDGYRAREREGACLASSWCLGGAQGGR